MSSIRWKLYLTNFFLGAGLYSSIEVLYLNSHNISAYMVSVLILFIPVCTAIFEIPTGIIGDYLGRVAIFRLTFISFFVGMVIIATSKNLPMFFLGYSFEALGYSFYSGNSESLLFESCQKENIDANKAMSNFYSTLTVGYIFSGVFVFILSNMTNVAILKVAIYGTLVLRFSAVLISIIAAKQNEEKIEQKPRQILMKSIKLLFKDRLSVSICIYDAFGRLQYFLPILYQPLLLTLGMKIEYIALIYSISQLFQVIFQKVSVTFLSKFGYKRVMAVTPVVQSIAILGFLTKNVPLIIIGIILVFSGISVKGQCTSLIRHLVVSDDIRATYMSLISLITLVLNSLYLNGVGFINDNNVTAATIFLSVSLFVVSEIVVFLINKNIYMIEVNNIE